MKIAYIHGFLSGPNAIKSNILKDYIKQNCPHIEFLAPDFSDIPQKAWQELCDFFSPLFKNNEPVGLCGSSMGGFFATLLSIKYNFKAVLINPCVHPHEYIKDLLGEHYNEATGRKFILEHRMIAYLKELDQCHLYDKDKIKVFLQSADEVLDYRKSEKFYKDTKPVVIAGGSHRFDNFEDICPQIIEFLTTN